VPFSSLVLPGIASSVCSNHRFWILGFSIYDCIEISYCLSQNIDFGTSLSFFDVLAAFLIKKREIHSLPHAENETQQSVNNFWSCIMGNLSGAWLQTFINEVLAALIGKRESHMLPAPF